MLSSHVRFRRHDEWQGIESFDISVYTAACRWDDDLMAMYCFSKNHTTFDGGMNLIFRPTAPEVGGMPPQTEMILSMLDLPIDPRPV